MIDIKKINAGLLTGSLLLAFSAQSAFAVDACTATPPNCYNFAGDPPTLGCYLSCAIPGVFGAFQLVMIAIAIIMAFLLVAKAVANRENSEFLSGLPNRIMYLLIFAFLAFGAGGTLLNIVLKFFGFGDFQGWLDILNEFFDKMNNWAQ